MVYIIKDDRVLFGVRSIEPGIGLLDVPGGFINPEETAEQAVARETKEEVGVDITLRHILGTYSSMYFGKRALSIVFVADYSGGEPSGSDDMSGGEIVWRDINNLPGAEELSWDWQTACQADLATWWQSQQ
jgi:ADP-ribose pyrophosphatase YjhB (NUDIX family)